MTHDPAEAALLGADNVAEGVVVDQSKIALGQGVMLDVAGPALCPGERVGWSFPPARARIGPAGAYEGMVEGVTAMGIECQIMVRLGGALIKISNGHADYVRGVFRRFDIDSYSIQVWPLA